MTNSYDNFIAIDNRSWDEKQISLMLNIIRYILPTTTAQWEQVKERFNKTRPAYSVARKTAAIKSHFNNIWQGIFIFYKVTNNF